ncbi:uncharacterized protein LOC123692122 isoform X4 [Colias croceus]|uniref:uncharacterized protein LOC123692122 isoform X4 n=1 Tax=Colias crocea TaxID=72248 RepID=UPI001E2805EE|nr:uncharacterized protein LOC123692122 isoform X4 [Colias croceus]
MKGLITISAILLQLSWCYGYPDPRGVGAYAYQDTAGNSRVRRFIRPGFPFRPFRPFRRFGTRRFPQFGPQNFFGPSGMPFDMSQNSAFASGVAGPGFTQQIAAINPESDLMKNVAITNRFNDDSNPNKFYSVSSSSYSSSSNLGGQAQSNRGAETVVNNNGKITKYRVQS